MKKGGFLFLVWLALVHFVLAKVETTTFTVSATIPAYSCIISATGLAFGTYYPGNASPSQNSNLVQVTCNGNLNVAIYPDYGLYRQNALGTTRAMSDGKKHFLSYEIFQDSTRNIIWDFTHPILLSVLPYTNVATYGYGKILEGQYQPSGKYQDTVTAIVSF